MLEKKLERLPEYIGGYRIIGRLGKGGMGDIYKAMQVPLERVVALKVLPAQLSRDDEFAKRFAVEAKAISLLEHQNIVSIYEYSDYGFGGDTDEYHFIAMQYIDGMDLGQYIADVKRVPIPLVIDFTKQICRGLRYAHARNVIHRDIKPQNILLDKNKIVHITDFGIAKVFSNSGITMTGSTIGTPEYMSPEQAQGKKIDAQSDIYSLGIVMYEMLTGRPPFTANNSMAVAYKQVHEIPPPPSLKRKDIPKQLDLIVQKALKKDKLERYQSVSDMLDHLDRVDRPEIENDSPTVHIKKPTTTQMPVVEPQRPERRIMERRAFTDRRRGGIAIANVPIYSRAYWRTMIRTQWVSWLALAGLGVAFALHVLKN